MEASDINIQGTRVGDGLPNYLIAEIGINHNGDMDVAKKLIDVAAVSGCQAVKFQKRTPELSTPDAQKKRFARDPLGDNDIFGIQKKNRVWG